MRSKADIGEAVLMQLSRFRYSDQQLALDWGIPAESARDSNAGAPF